MFQHLKECFRSNLWAMMGKLDQKLPADYQFPIIPLIYSDIPKLAFPIDTTDYKRRVRVLISSIVLTENFGGNTTYLRNQGRVLTLKLLNKNEENLARFLDLELERISDDVY